MIAIVWAPDTAEEFRNKQSQKEEDNKARYMVGSEGCRISNIFAKIEEDKEGLWCVDYSVSQTSLEQVFNFHAAEAEKHKQGRDER